jgi:hypothetical protein
MYKIIIEDPHLVDLAGLGDHQMKTALMNVEKVSKWLKGSLRIHTLLDLGGVGERRLRTPLKNCGKLSRW